MVTRNEQNVVVCQRVDGRPAIDGATVHACEKCGTPVLLSPATARTAPRPFTLLCPDCCVVGPGDRILPLHPEQLRELAEFVQSQRRAAP
ncbi:MAG TPA: hypothetical protein PK082_01675 [Phycisphaerae bacterium]|nr:hypothetical protein [Phycisphaerae bacterium]